MDRRAFLTGASALAVTGAVSGCSSTSVWAPDDAIQRARYVHSGAPSVTVFTVKNVGSDNGAHTGLLINARERILFDGAGSYSLNATPERNDVHYGMTPAAVDFYIDFHARSEYYVTSQHIFLPLASADAIYAAALQAGPVPNALCTTRTTQVLKAAPEFADVNQSFFPTTLERHISALPNVITRTFRDDDDTRENATFGVPGQPIRFSIE